MQNTSEIEEEINLFEIISVIWKRKGTIIFVTIVSFFIATWSGIVISSTKYITEVMISLDFPGIEEHKYPDGTLFEERQIIAPKILSEANSLLEREREGFPANNLRNFLHIQPVIPPEIVEKINNAKIEKKTFLYFPNQFRLTLTTVDRMIIQPEKRTQALLSIIDEYRNEFDRKYGETPLISVDFPNNFISSYDYIDVVAILRIRLDNANNFLKAKIEKTGLFRSLQTGRSFIDIKDDIQLIRGISLDKVEATIKTLNLTKNREDLVNQYRYKVKLLDVDMQKKEAGAQVAVDLLKDLRAHPGVSGESRGNSIASAGNIVIDNTFIESLIKNNYYQTLIETALTSRTEAKELELERIYWENKIGELTDKNKINKVNEKINEKKLQVALKTIQDELTPLLKEANTLNKEYLNNFFGNSLQISRGPDTFKVREGNLKMIIILTTLIGFMGSIFLVFILEFISNAKTTRQVIEQPQQ